MATVAEEITKQAGSAAEFSKMNRIQQEAMAEAVGMTADQLASALVEQEALKSVGKQLSEQEKEAYEAYKKQYGAAEAAKKLKKDGIETLMEEKSLADERQAQQEKFQAAIQGLATAMLPFFEMLSEVANVLIPLISIALEPIRMTFEGISGILSGNIGELSTMSKILGTIALSLGGAYATYKSIVAIQQTVNALKGKEIVLESRSGIIKAAQFAKDKAAAAVGIVKGAWSSLGPIPFVGAGLAAAAIVAAIAYMNSQASKGNDVFSPAPGGSGYGKRTLLGPEGAIQLNNKDTIIAGTNLFGNDVKSEPGKPTKMGSEGEIKIKTEGGKGMDMSSVVNAINALGAKVEALANRPINVNADGKKIIEATTNARPIESGEAAAKNSYKIQ
jgi:ABC-type multidrug transport system fused ATPase/permease subunit